jgi:hypothetical protein
MSDFLHVRLGTPDAPVELGMFEQFAEHLRGAFRELAREGGAEGKVQVRFDIRDAQKGSLVLALEPRLTGEGLITTEEIVDTLIDDINSLADDTPRPTIGTSLLQQYRALVSVAQKAGGLQVRYRQRETMIGPEQEVAFRAVLKEQPEAGATVVGTIEMVNIHARPWKFGLYTKLDHERVECLFSEPMLDRVFQLMERKATVEVRGEAQYGPVGATPRTILLDAPPIALEFDPRALLAYRRSADFLRFGETEVEAVGRVREERASYGD